MGHQKEGGVVKDKTIKKKKIVTKPEKYEKVK